MSTQGLLDIHRSVLTTLAVGDPADVLSIIGESLGLAMGVLWEIDGDGRRLAAREVWTAPTVTARALEAATWLARYAKGEGKPGLVWQTRRPYWQNDLQDDPAFLRRDVAVHDGLRSAIWLPVEALDEVWGVLEFFSDADAVPEPELIDALRLIGQAIGVYMRTVRLHDQRLAGEREARTRIQTQLDERTAQLEHSELKLQRLYDSDLIGFLVGGFDGRVIEANDALLALLHCNRADLERGALRWDRLTPDEWADADAGALEQLRTTGVAHAYEKEFLRPDGSRVPVVIGAAVLRDRETSICFVLDNTARKRIERDVALLNAELYRRVEQRTTALQDSEATTEVQATAIAASAEQLRALAMRLMSLREENGLHLAREIHDVLGTDLAGLKMDASWALRRLAAQVVAAPEQLIERLRAMVDGIDRMVVTIRRIATDLRPLVLDDLGLTPALRWSLREFEARSGVLVEADLADVGSLDSALATALFRITQELLTNVARHAEATAVAVSLSSSEDGLELRVRDDGKGIDELRVGATASLGHVGIRERALAFGGSFEIGRVPAPGVGTEAVVRIPAVLRPGLP